MHPQLQAIVTGLESASERLSRLARSVPDERWGVRPHAGGWSASECVAHLNLTGEAYLPILRAGIKEAGSRTGGAPARYRRDLVGWLLWKTMGPPVRMRVRTPPPFVPRSDLAPEALRQEFERLQAEQIAIVQAADGRPLHEVRVRSPFSPRVGYNLFSALTLLAPHQHRHLWQAERVLDVPSR